MEKASFKFRLIKVKYIYRLLGAIIGGFALLISLLLIESFFLIKNSNYIELATFFIILLIVMICGYCVFKIIQSTRQGRETVSLTSSGIQSKVFGDIPYAKIHSYWIDLKFTWLNWDNPAPGLRIRLKNNILITYDLLSKNNEEGKQEAEVYFSFVLHFMDQMKALDTQGELSESYFKALAKMEKARKRKNNPPVYLYAILLLIFGSILLLTTLIK
ncbi:hypothetical protein NWE55_00700 [Myroides albus]|uniref:Uncharacterized protein n=1 Tax=Myroides albus TaxID=2562892 RepID=A0A6I3LTF4_9FLAO|nr:hypothetical protein [Myroides albus]MTG99255.1 hypothetical protein [Myroides albus]UVD79845.1 hypothetical protein NWE55_00700 [Myroides albus]